MHYWTIDDDALKRIFGKGNFDIIHHLIDNYANVVRKAHSERHSGTIKV
jgi:hypothetical protein